MKSIIFQLPSWETSYFLKGMICQPRYILRTFLNFWNFQPIPSYKLHSYKKKLSVCSVTFSCSSDGLHTKRSSWLTYSHFFLATSFLAHVNSFITCRTLAAGTWRITSFFVSEICKKFSRFSLHPSQLSLIEITQDLSMLWKSFFAFL